MALFVKQNEPRNELQLRIAADLDRRQKERDTGGIEAPKTQPTILDDTQTTNGAAWVWLVIMGVILIAGFIWLII